MSLSTREQTFVTHFGEMGARWGVNRTVGQIYAVLFLSDKPLCADDLVAGLFKIERFNGPEGAAIVEAGSPAAFAG